jgi:molybdopterin-binding protein
VTAISSRDIAATQAESPKPHLDHPMGVRTLLIFLAVMALGLFFAAYNIYRDISAAGATVTSILPFLLLGVALLIALGFEFVNGFHDTANAVATVIYTHSLAPPVAVVWSGFFNFFGVSRLCQVPEHRPCVPSLSKGKNDMKISARNLLEGKIKEVHKGATTAHVEIELKGGEIVISSITNEAVEELGLKKGTQAYAVIKASDVMIAIK